MELNSWGLEAIAGGGLGFVDLFVTEAFLIDQAHWGRAMYEGRRGMVNPSPFSESQGTSWTEDFLILFVLFSFILSCKDEAFFGLGRPPGPPGHASDFHWCHSR